MEAFPSKNLVASDITRDFPYSLQAGMFPAWRLYGKSRTTQTASSPAISPTLDQIPQNVRVTYDGGGARYLIDGLVHSWSGPCQEVLSPVCTVGEDGPSPYKLGRYPLLDEEHSLKALEAASNAYDRGCGKWPTMSVADRIHHLESFIPRMEAVRDEVVRLMMWEIGKTLTANPMSGDDIGHMVKRRVKDAGLPKNLSPHSVRATTATDLINHGVPLENVQHLLGHADARTTKLYDRRRRKVTRNIVERISIRSDRPVPPENAIWPDPAQLWRSPLS